MKNIIQSKEPMTIWVCGYDKKLFEEPFLLRATKMEFVGNHLMFYLKKELIFKVWIKSDKYEKYKDIDEAMKEAELKF